MLITKFGQFIVSAEIKRISSERVGPKVEFLPVLPEMFRFERIRSNTAKSVVARNGYAAIMDLDHHRMEQERAPHVAPKALC